MKKSKKIRIGVITGVIVAAITGTLLGVFIPKLLDKTKIKDLEKNQVIPSKGNGNFMEYNLKTEIDAMPYNQKIESLETFTKEALKNDDSYQKLLTNFVDNYIIQFWKGYKGSEAFTERYDGWIKSINDDWDAKVKDYKSRYGSNWTFYFQLEVLDPVGGNEIDWKRNQLRNKINADFDTYIWDQSYIHPLAKGAAFNGENGSKVITKYKDSQGNYNNDIIEYLKSGEVANGQENQAAPTAEGVTGKRNRIVFSPTENEVGNDKAKLSKANFQEFVFNEWIRSEVPLITTMTLWKHSSPTEPIDGYYNFFNKEIAELIYSGNMSISAIDESSSETNDSSSSAVGITADYKWQAFPKKSNPYQTGEENPQDNTTDKYLNFVAQSIKDGGLTKAFQVNKDGTVNPTGAVDIDVKYTDDSATLFYIELGNSSSSAIEASYTEYATAATYKFNTLLFGNENLDTNVPTLNALKDKPFIEDRPSGSEIMNNFLTKTAGQTGYFDFPKQVQAIIDDSVVGSYRFNGMYNGAKGITDTVNIPNSPFILSRNKAGVHIIGIDRYSKLKEAATIDPDSIYNEIANTVLWRHVLSEAGVNKDGGYTRKGNVNNGFTLDVYEKIKNFFNSNRNELIYKYIKANEEINANKPTYVFSSAYTEMDSSRLVKDSKLVPYFDAKQELEKYKKNIGYNEKVTTKIIDLVNSFGLLGKTLGNKVVSNGIAGQLPFTRNKTPDPIPNPANKGYEDRTFGMYDSLQLYYGLDKTQPYKNSVFKTKVDAFTTAAEQVWTDLNTTYTLGMKPLTYESAKYNQYLLLGTNNDTSTALYASDVELVSECLNGWVTANTSTVKNMLDTQRMLSDVNGLNKEEEGSDSSTTTRAVGPQNIFDATNYGLVETYTTPYDFTTTVPAEPTDNTNKDNINKFVNYHLQKAYDKYASKSRGDVNRVQHQGEDGVSLELISKSARVATVDPFLNNPYDNSFLDLVKDYIGIKAAFDFNEETGEFEFTKFRDYLIQQTNNEKKASFVWVANELSQAVQGYEEASINDHFAYKNVNYQTSGWIDVNGYVFQGAPKRDAYVNPDMKFKEFGTFSQAQKYENAFPVQTGKQEYTGFQGMVFENSSGGADLTEEIKTALFGNKVYVYENTETVAPFNTSNLMMQGALYNIGSRDKLVKITLSEITNWATLQKKLRWLSDTFNCDVSKVSQTDLNQAREDVETIIRTQVDPDTIDPDTGKPALRIPDSLFTRNVNKVLAEGENSESQFFGEADKIYHRINQVVFTQFNHEDVLHLFNTDTSTDIATADPTKPIPVVDEKDKGINWAALKDPEHGGFLGTSAEAFFYCAIEWYYSQSTSKTSAVKKANKRQGKVKVFDRRLNDAFGKDLVEDYKKNN